MLIADGHLDLAWNALQWNRNLLDTVYTIRSDESQGSGPGRALGTVALPDMRAGRIALSFATLLARATGHTSPHIDYATSFQSDGIAHGQLAYYRALERAGHIRIITDAAKLDAHMLDWEGWESHHPEQSLTGAPVLGNTPPLGFVILMEGADPIQGPDQLQAWHAAGLRILGLTHYGVGRYAGGTATDVGLAEACLPLLREMERLGIILDLTHCSDPAFWQALEHFGGPVLASHNNCRSLVPHQRQFSDDQLRAIITRGGVIGVVLDSWMLKPGWLIGRDNNVLQPQVMLSHVIDHIDHICHLAGDSSHVAIGSDLDGGFGREATPCDLDTIADLQKLDAQLRQRGYGASDVAGILHGNWLRLLRQSWN
jgi:membrane dipeptidase